MLTKFQKKETEIYCEINQDFVSRILMNINDRNKRYSIVQNQTFKIQISPWGFWSTRTYFWFSAAPFICIWNVHLQIYTIKILLICPEQKTISFQGNCVTQMCGKHQRIVQEQTKTDSYPKAVYLTEIGFILIIEGRKELQQLIKFIYYIQHTHMYIYSLFCFKNKARL